MLIHATRPALQICQLAASPHSEGPLRSHPALPGVVHYRAQPVASHCRDGPLRRQGLVLSGVLVGGMVPRGAAAEQGSTHG